MDQTNRGEKRKPSAKAIVARITISLVIAIVCFTIVMLLPESEEPFFDSALRGALTGVGLLGVAWPLLIAGSRLREHAAGSPYFEEGFIAGVLSLFGYIILLVGLVCLTLAAYALLARFLIMPR